MISILKFFENAGFKDKNGGDAENEVISRTLLKIAVVSRHYKQKHPDNMPKHGELWRCKIVKETNSGKNKGLFVVTPIEKVDDESLVHLIPGWFDSKLVNNRLIIVPRKQNVNWILPLTHKRIMAEEHGAYCVIVTLDSMPIVDAPADVPFPSAGMSVDEET